MGKANSDGSSLGDRMKRYEAVWDMRLPRRCPVVVRLDGRAFHTLTAHFEKPHDAGFAAAMDAVSSRLLSEVSGAILAYTQSDEISLVLRNDQTHQTEPWFDNRLQKLASITAAIASVEINRELALQQQALFDARAFVLPDWTEVENYLIWRQRDAIRNSIQAAAQHSIGAALGRKTARKRLHGLDIGKQQDSLLTLAGVNWNNFSPRQKRGGVITKCSYNGHSGCAQIFDWPEFSSDMGRSWLRMLWNQTGPIEERLGSSPSSTQQAD